VYVEAKIAYSTVIEWKESTGTEQKTDSSTGTEQKVNFKNINYKLQ
jgi:hypothetical protein